jgi:hypothetical protein
MINQQEAERRIESFKKDHLAKLKGQVILKGGLEPQITVFLYKHETNQYLALEVSIPENLMTPEGKEHLFEFIMPHLFESISNNHGEILCVGWASEAWITIFPKGMTSIPEDRSKFPKREMFMCSHETENYSTVDSYLMNRKGSAVAEGGNLIDMIELEHYISMDSRNEDHIITGHISNLFRKYKKP